jgi:outer membrane receptor protein involved in Fe transport
VRETQNAGETLHRGLELALGAELPAGVVAQLAWSYAKLRRRGGQRSTDYSGQEMERAAHHRTSSLSWRPDGVGGPGLAVEWLHLGEYWLDPANTVKYDGHDLLNVQASWPAMDHITLFGKLNNVTDERYAESAGWSAFRGRELAPGLPRTLYLGAQLSWRGR